MKALHDTINDRYIISTYFDKAAKTYITSVTDKHTLTSSCYILNKIKHKKNKQNACVIKIVTLSLQRKIKTSNNNLKTLRK